MSTQSTVLREGSGNKDYIVQETIEGNDPRQVSEVENEWRGGK